MSLSSSDRNLLVGFLSLQMDFITREQLVAAIGVWVRDKSQALDELLLASKAIDAETQKLIIALVNKHLELNDGSVEKSLAAVRCASLPLRNELEALHDKQVDATLSVVGNVSTEDRDWSELGSTMSLGSSSSESRYQILRPHAKGGLGLVSVALDRELHREVALKEILDQHADHPESRGRFLVEAEITGGLEHPGIVPVYGLGAYPNGRPFYAMRLIKGESLKATVDRFHQSRQATDAGSVRGLEFRQLLSRFVSVCHALEYAHSRGVLHRDLKPSNIMLGRYGETLVVDWGLAKVVGRSETHADVAETTLPLSPSSGHAATQLGAAIGTPQYMSPEQADGQLDRLTATSDIYSLGATLYYLLTGKAAFEKADLAELLARVRSGNFASPRQINSRVPAALDAVCLKAMSLDPKARYESAASLAQDLERWLADEPVSCHAEPIAVRASRWARRHQAFVWSSAVAASLLIVSLSLGVLLVAENNRQLAREEAKLNRANGQLASTVKRLEESVAQERLARSEADAQRDLANQSASELQTVLRFFEERVLAAARPVNEDGGLGPDTTIQEAIDEAEPFIASAFAQQPRVEAWIRNMIGVTYTYLDQNELALQQHLRVKELCDRNIEPTETFALMNRSNVGLALLGLKREKEAVEVLSEVYDLTQSMPQPDPDRLISARSNLGLAYRSMGDFDLAESLIRESIQDAEEAYGPDDERTLRHNNQLTTVLWDAGQRSEAIDQLEKTLERRRETLGDDHPSTLTSLSNLGFALMKTDDLQGALPLLIEAVERNTRVRGANHPTTLSSISTLGLLYFSLDRSAEALQLLEPTYERAKLLYGAEHTGTLEIMLVLAQVHEGLGDYEQAIALFEEHLEITTRNLGLSNRETINTMSRLGQLYLVINNPDRARELLETALKQADENLTESDPIRLNVRADYTLLLSRAGELDRAIPLLLEQIEIEERVLGPKHPDLLISKSALAQAYSAAGRTAESLALQQEVFETKVEVLGSDDRSTLLSQATLGYALVESGKGEEGIAMLNEVKQKQIAQLTLGHPDTITTCNMLIVAHQMSQQLPEAIEAAKEALQGLEQIRFEHIDSRRIFMNGLVVNLDMDQTEEGLRWMRSWLAARKAQVGEQSSDYTDEFALCAALLMSYEKWNEAEDFAKQCMELRSKVEPESWSYFHSRAVCGRILFKRTIVDSSLESSDSLRAQASELLESGYGGMKERIAEIPANRLFKVTEVLEDLVQLEELETQEGEERPWKAELEAWKASHSNAPPSFNGQQ